MFLPTHLFLPSHELLQVSTWHLVSTDDSATYKCVIYLQCGHGVEYSSALTIGKGMVLNG